VNSDFEQLKGFCQLVNREIRRYYGRPDSCVFSTAVIVEVLTHFNLKAEPLRVEAAVFPEDRKRHGCILGSFGDGTRRSAAGKGMWLGHLVTLVAGYYLLDSTIDQVKVPGVQPIVLDLRQTKWFKQNPPYRGTLWTGVLRPWPGIQARYTMFHRQNGWKHAGDFRSCRRKEMVALLIEKSTLLFGGLNLSRGTNSRLLAK
jgi:hypothetical protein